MWEHRNNVVHEKTKETAIQRKLEAVRRQVRETLESPPMLGARDRHLLKLTEVNSRTGRYLHHWRTAVRAAEAQEYIRHKTEERHKILEYVQETRRQQRLQPVRRQQQTFLFEFAEQGLINEVSPTQQQIPPAALQYLGVGNLQIAAQRELESEVAPTLATTKE